MPRVPEYQPGQVQQRGVPSVRQELAPAGAFLGAAEGLSQLAGTMSDIAFKMQVEQDETAALQIDNQFRDALRQKLQGDEGYYNQRGQNAMSGHDATVADINKLRQEYLGMAQNPRQRAALMRSINGRTESELDKVATHAANERRAWMAETHKKAIETNIEDAIADPVNFGMHIGKVRESVKTVAKQQGLGEEWVNATVRDATTKIHTGIIEQLMVTHPGAARQWYEKARKAGEIDGDAIPKIEKALEVSVVRAASQAEAARIQAATTDYEKQVQLAKKIKDPKVQDETLERLDKDFNRTRAIEASHVREAKKAAWNHVKKGGTVDTLPANVVADLEGTFIAALKRGTEPDTDWKLVNDLNRLMIDSPEVFADPEKTDLWKYRTQLDDTQWQKFSNAQVMLNRREEKEVRRQSRITRGMSIAKPFIANLSDDNKGKFQDSLINELDMAVKDGKVLGDKDVSAIVHSLLQKVEIDWGIDKPAYRAEDTDRVVVPENIRQDIIDSFTRKFKRAPSDQEINHNYLKAVRSGKIQTGE